jgi:glycerol-3-phosphate dehydrogenase
VQTNHHDRPSLTGQHFDVLVIGGGINGIAIARECVRGGKRALVVEQNDFASGTTSRSTRIIHGGLRYLEHAEVGLVRESLRERQRLLAESPNLVQPLQFLLALPAQSGSLLRSSLAIRTGLWLYRRWAGAQPAPSNTLVDFDKQLDSGHRWRVFPYEDAQCEFPERLAAEWLTEAADSGAVVRNHTRVLQVLRDNNKKRVTGARLRQEITGEEFTVTATSIVNATGPWADSVVNAADLDCQRMIGGVRGSHLVLPQFPAAPHEAIYTEGIDGRPIFVIPWNGQILVGTSEVADGGDPGDPQPTASEIDYLFRSFLRLFPGSGLGPADARYTFAGIRPLPYAPGKKASDVTRRHIIHDHAHEGAAGLLSIIGGKLTTAASLAREVAGKLGVATREPAGEFAIGAPHDGIESTLRQWAWMVAGRAGIPAASAEAIAQWHGRHALAIAHTASLDQRLRAPLCGHTEHIVAEAVEAVSYEHAVTLGDILLRRVPVSLGACWSEACSREAADKICDALAWDKTRVHAELDRFENERERFLHPKPTVSSPSGKAV